ncbi:MAG: CRISPR-associated helicase Cas3' [Oscillospiraceae bacterium]|jgi:CRISPR-associated endonuclease/helicase Cas3|nr:CRISPR-associated helicase Cas3' [Oscillospiraceae bacterium]
MEYAAHVKQVNGERFVQTMRAHLRKTAEYAAANLKGANLEKTGYLCGLLHDAGKYTQKYCDYIEKAARDEDVVRGSVNHTFAGVIFALERWHQPSQNTPQVALLAAELIAYAVGAHHGEFDIVGTNCQNGFLHRLEKDRAELHYDEAIDAFLTDVSLTELDGLFAQAVCEIEAAVAALQPVAGGDRSLHFYLGMLARLLLSALIDADRQDTAEFEFGFSFSPKDVPPGFWSENLTFFESEMAKITGDSSLNRARAQISDFCYEKAFAPAGIYRLNVPTGGGKTLATLRYALAHNKEHAKNRAIFIIPLLSVLEQNSGVISDYVKDKGSILEHHSNVVQEKKEAHGELEPYELLTQTWGRPIVISTLVQLLNLLFSHKTTDIRRMVSLIDSTIVIDEIQSLPLKTVSLFNLAMNFLSAVCGTTVVLSSATQPRFDAAKYPVRFAEQADIVTLDEELLRPFQRTEIVDCCTKYGMEEEELEDFAAEICESSRSLLLICNTKSTAKAMFSRLERLKKDGWNVFHLSTFMCPAHRSETLANINRSLDTKSEKTLCVATQLVEAGIDFSFESVIRVLAGMDSVAQAAGRCNRNGEFLKLCRVYIVNLKNEPLRNLKEIKTAQDHAASLLENFSKDPLRFQNSLLSAPAVSAYYGSLFADKNVRVGMDYPLPHGKKYTLFDLLSDNAECTQGSLSKNQGFLLKQAFRTANGIFKVFVVNTSDIIVRLGAGKELIADLCSEKAKHDMAFLFSVVERAKPYTVSVFEYTKKKLEENGLLKQHENSYFITLNPRGYNDATGLDVNGDYHIGNSHFEGKEEF